MTHLKAALKAYGERAAAGMTYGVPGPGDRGNETKPMPNKNDRRQRWERRKSRTRSKSR